MGKSAEEMLNDIMEDLKTDEALRILHKGNEVREKREIKNEVNKKNKQSYKGKQTRRKIKAILATLLVVGGIGVGTHTYIQNQAKDNEVANMVEDLSDEEIKDEIYNIIESEISQATGDKKDDIRISQSMVGSGTSRIKVQAGDKEYVHETDLDSPVSFGNTLESTTISSLINEANTAEDRKHLIRTLRKAREFSKEKDLKVENNNLKEVDDEGR